MAGLILAGLGKGIADAGAAYGSALLKEEEERARQERESVRDEKLAERERIKAEAAVAREEARADAKIRAEEQKVERETATRAAQVQTVERVAPDLPVRRDAAGLGLIASQIEGDSPQMTQQEREDLIRANPQYRDVYEKAGYLKKDEMDPRSRLAEDKLLVAGSIGAHAKVIEQYTASRKAVLDEIKEENKEARETRRADQTDRRITQQGEIADKRIAAIAARSGGSDKDGGPASKLDNQAENLRKAMNDETDPDEKAKLKARYNRVLDQIEALQTPKSTATPAAAKTAPAAPKGGDNKASPSGGVARPTSMAEFKSLPSGARYVNPKDGKTYIKN